MTTTKPLRAAIYVRISNDPNGQRAGVQRQRVECQELAERHGLTVVAVYEDDDVSAYSRKPRPQFEAMMRDASNRHFDVVICWANDRLARRMSDWVRIIDELASSVRLLTVQGGESDLATSDGVLHAHMMGSVAQHESARKAERVKSAIVQRVSAGRMTATSRPFGWSWVDPCPGGSECLHLDSEGEPRCERGQVARPRAGSRRGLTINESEAVAVRYMYEALARGDSLRSVMRWLAEHGYVGTSGRPFTWETVRGVVKSPRHAGYVSLKKTIVRESADGARIVEPELFERVQSLLSDPARRTAPGRPSGTLLSAIAVCGECGGPMNASRKHAPRLPEPLPIYVCGRAAHVTRRRALVDEPVIAAVATILLEQIDEVRSYARGVVVAGNDDERALEKLLSRKQQLDDALDAGEFDDALDYARAVKVVRAQIKELRAHASRRAGRPALAQLAAHEDPSAKWRELVVTDVDTARTVLRDLMERVVVLRPAVRHHPSVADIRPEGGFFSESGPGR
jgi:site-specific DNA recombinase